MRRRAGWVAGALATVLTLASAGWWLVSRDDGYRIRVVMPNAANLLAGSRVEIDGARVGEVTALAARDGKALVTVSVDERHAPLRAGTTVRVEWRGVLGERVVALDPGPRSNAAIPSGGMIAAGSEQVELDQVLAALDPDTRKHLNSTVRQLDASLKAHSGDLNDTLRAAGPAVRELGEVLKAIGQDGPAIKNLIAALRELTAPMAARQAKVRRTVADLTATSRSIAAEQERLRQALAQLPATLDAAGAAMRAVPGAVDSTVPVLNDLRPAADRLPSVARNLSPLLTDLRPALADLRPTLASADAVLARTPSLLDTTHAVLPGVDTAVTRLNPAVNFLRPYTPDLVGWLSNWGAAFGNYDAQGHYFHGLVVVGTNVLDDNPGVIAGLKGGPKSRPVPGMASGNGWVDANGSEPR